MRRCDPSSPVTSSPRSARSPGPRPWGRSAAIPKTPPSPRTTTSGCAWLSWRTPSSSPCSPASTGSTPATDTRRRWRREKSRNTWRRPAKILASPHASPPASASPSAARSPPTSGPATGARPLPPSAKTSSPAATKARSCARLTSTGATVAAGWRKDFDSGTRMMSSEPGLPTTEAGDAASGATGSAVLRGGAWSAARVVGPQLFVLAVSVAAARFLGPDQMGRQSFIAFVALSIAAIFNGGISQMLTRFVGEGIGAGRPATTRGLIARSYRVGALGAVLGAMVLFGAALAGQEPTAAWWLAGVGCGLAIVQAMPNAILSGTLRWRETSIIGLVTGAAAVPITIAVLAAGGGITGFFAVEVAMIAANMAWSEVACRRALRDLGSELRHDRSLERPALSFAGLPTISIVLSTTVSKR